MTIIVTILGGLERPRRDCKKMLARGDSVFFISWTTLQRFLATI